MYNIILSMFFLFLIWDKLIKLSYEDSKYSQLRRQNNQNKPYNVIVFLLLNNILIVNTSEVSMI